METFLPPSAGRAHHQRSHSESSSSSNPLLDTISVLTYDPNEDSDDYYDFAFARPRTSTSSTGGPEDKRVDIDRDSVGYAGSNSVDSGYKSLCPTPEIPEISYEPRGACAAPDPQDKRKILMGTKVMDFSKPKCTRPESNYYTVDLDHLMYLRQSLLSAIQKCEAVRTAEDTVPSASGTALKPTTLESSPIAVQSVTKRPPVRQRRRSDAKSPSTSSSSDSSPSSQKTVRFEADVRVTGSPRSSPRPSRKQSKSILKDPLCASIRSKLSGSEAASGCSFEEEIDTLLYGKAEYYDLENVREFPSSYVTMIEEKYKGGKASVAKVKRLKETEKAKSISSSCRPADLLTSSLRTNAQQMCPPPEVVPSSPSSTSSGKAGKSKGEKEPTKSKNRFTEVARCMLEILEDIHFKKSPKSSSEPHQSTLPRSWRTKKERQVAHRHADVRDDLIRSV